MHYEEKKTVFWDFRGREIPAIECVLVKNLDSSIQVTVWFCFY